MQQRFVLSDTAQNIFINERGLVLTGSTMITLLDSSRSGLLSSLVRCWILSLAACRTPPLSTSNHRFLGRLSSRLPVSQCITHFPQCGPSRQPIHRPPWITLRLHLQEIISPAHPIIATDNKSTSWFFEPATKHSPTNTPRKP